MSQTFNLGAVTPYAKAIAAGTFTGTETEYNIYLASLPQYATSAKSSADNAKISENNAKTSETNAAASVTTATAQATIATNKASAAATSETNAASSATTATAKATIATDAANTATEKATTLSNSVDAITDLQNYTASLDIGYSADDIYGVEADMTNKTFTRLAGAVGKTAGADFDSINAFWGRKRCILTDSGKRLAYYGQAGYTETGALTQEITADGTTYPAGTPVQVMVEQPKFYYKVVPLSLEKIIDGKGYHLRKARYYISDTPRLGFKVHPAFISNGVEKDYIYLSAYEGSLYDVSASAYIADDAQVADFTASTGDKLSSIANVKPISGAAQYLTRTNARTLAHNRGGGWELQTIQFISATQLLFLIEYATLDAQTAIGNGVANKTDDGSTNMAELTGSTTNLGNTSGSVTNTNGYNVVSYRGEENLWGNILKWIDGININANTINEAYIADNTFSDNKLDGTYSNAKITLAKENGYISAFGYNEDFDWLFLASETFGNSSLPVGDYFYQKNTYNGIPFFALGGAWCDGTMCGIFYYVMANSSNAYTRNYSCRLSYIPQ